MIVSKSSLWALRALIHMGQNQPGTVFLTDDVAAATGAPRHFLVKVVRRLALAGMLITQPGVGGGVLLARPPDSISLMEVLVALGDPLAADDSSVPGAERTYANLHQLLASLRAEAITHLQATTIADMLPPPGGEASYSAGQKACSSSDHSVLAQEAN